MQHSKRKDFYNIRHQDNCRGATSGIPVIWTRKLQHVNVSSNKESAVVRRTPCIFAGKKQWWPNFSTLSATLLKSVWLKTQRWIPWTVMGDRFNSSSHRQTAHQHFCCGTRPKWGVELSTCPTYFSPSSQGFTLNSRNQITKQSMNQQSPTSSPWCNQGIGTVIFNCQVLHRSWTAGSVTYKSLFSI